MTKRQYLCLQRRSRPEQSDQRQPNQAANISHQPRASPDSTSLASRIEFPTMTRRPGEFGEEALDEIEPRTMLGREGKLEASRRSSVEPGCCFSRYVRGMIIEDHRQGAMFPGGWLFPGQNPVKPISTRQLARADGSVGQPWTIDQGHGGAAGHRSDGQQG